MTEEYSNPEAGPENGQKEATIKEEYQLWRQNCRYMYEFVSETALTWPSITFLWLPKHEVNDREGTIEARLLLGTHTSGEDTNYLKVASTQLPLKRDGEGLGDGDKSKKVTSRIKITEKLRNNYEINRARYMPQGPSIVGTINGEGEIDIYNLNDKTKESYAHLTPHDANGYGLSWNSFKKGYLITASDDRSVVLTDISQVGTGDTSIARFQNHQDIVNDSKWHAHDENLFGSVSDDESFLLYDIRAPEKPVLNFYSRDSKGINTLSFSPFSKHLVALGNTDSNISLLDTRKLSASSSSRLGLLHTMMGHSDSITSLEFSPHKDGVIASGSQDRRLILWDLFKIGEEQAQEDAEDGCPELFMMHAGHTGAVTDLAWCPYKEWTLGSVADDNIVHLWEVGKSLLNSDSTLGPSEADLE